MPVLLDNINILLFVVAIINLLLGLVVFFSGRKKSANIIYSINILSLIGWILGMILYRSASSAVGIFWCTILYVLATFIPSIFLYFTYVFPTRETSGISRKVFIISFLNFIVVFMTIWPGFIIKEVNIRPGLEKEIIFNKYYWFYFIYIFGLFNYGFYRLYIKYRKTLGVKRQQILYVLLGVFLSTASAFLTNLFFPWLGYFFVNWLGQVFTIFMVIFTAYAIMRYRLMDIRIVARRVFIYFGVTVFSYGIFYFLIWFYNEFFGGIFSVVALIVGLIIAPLFVFGFYGVDRGLKFLANKYLFVSLYNYQETINRLTDELANYIDLGKIISLLVDTIKKTMQLDRAGVLLVNAEAKPTHYQIAKVIGFNENNGISLVQDSFLTKQLFKSQKPLVSDELLILSRDAKTVREREGFSRLYEHMKHIEASLCLPLISNNKLIGLVVLGAKISGDAYTKEDLELLNTLSKQAGVTIENARQYKQIQEFGKTLQGKVDEQTRDISKKSEEIKEKNKYLKELLEMKSDFLRVVNHQLNTPLSVMNSYFSMMEEGSYKTGKALPAIKAGLERINATVADFWDAYELEGERMKMAPQPTDLAEIVERLAKEKKKLQLALERKLTIAIKQPSFKLPPVWCDAKKITHVISNLLDNAVYYTRAGGVTISYELLDENYLKLNIKDTGVGLTEEDKSKLFQKFSRGQNATNLRPDGSGLGLFIARKIVEGNAGKLTCVSEGRDKGATFSFTLPLFKNQRTSSQTTQPLARPKIMRF